MSKKILYQLSGSKGRVKFLERARERIKRESNLELTDQQIIYRMIRYFYDHPDRISELVDVKEAI